MKQKLTDELSPHLLIFFWSERLNITETKGATSSQHGDVEEVEVAFISLGVKTKTDNRDTILVLKGSKSACI